MPKSNRGMTLLELIIVVIVVVALTAILLPHTLGTGVKVPKVSCINNLMQIYLVMTAYAQDHDGDFPWAGEGKAPWEHLQILIDEGYVKNPKIFLCVSQNMEYEAGIERDNDGYYQYTKDDKIKLSYETCSYTICDKPLNIEKSNPETILIVDKDIAFHHKDGYCFIRLDCKAAFEKADKLPSGLIDCSKYVPQGWAEKAAKKESGNTLLIVLIVSGVALIAVVIAIWQIRKRKRDKAL